MDPVHNRDQFAIQPRNKCFNEDSHNSVCLRSILTEFQGLSSSIVLNITTLPTSGKSVVVKNLPRNIILYFSAFCGS